MAKIKVTKDGPYIVLGKVPMDNEIIGIGNEGEPQDWVQGKKFPEQEGYALCRCGKSKACPFCDGSHTDGFDGTETAGLKIPEDRKGIIDGPQLKLTDVEELCAGARFCHRSGGTWALVQSDDPKFMEIAKKESCDCPSGRLTISHNGNEIEPKFQQSISVTEDPQKKCSGPLWVKGGIPIESCDGKQYEVRNRMTLCRCGKSSNKPFCDGTHMEVGFNDGDESLTSP